MAVTTNYGYTLPVDQGDVGVWGPLLNTNLTDIDQDIFDREGEIDATEIVANAALARAGGAMTGEIDILTSRGTRVDLGNISGTGTLDFDAANAWTATVTGVVTIALANVPTGTFIVGGVFLIINGGSSAVTWPAAFDWPGGTAPTLTTSGNDLIAFLSFDAGTSFKAIANLDMS
jgi:hypothetical protein